jgi:extradiol dioxygenase family protein
MKRPNAAYRSADGLLCAEQFQIAYATNDIDRARGFFQEQYGIKEFRRLAGPLTAGGQIHVELAWVGNTMYELLTAMGPGAELYVGRLPTTEFAIRHHHLVFLIHDETEWNALFAEVDRKSYKLLAKSNSPDFMQSCFIQVPQLEHYLEFLFPQAAGLAFLEGVPGN